MNKEETKKETPVSSKGEKKQISITIEKGTLIRMIVLLVLALLIVGCIAKKETKMVYCESLSGNMEGWVSAESDTSYWVVSEKGKVVEFSKNKCFMQE